MRNSYLAVLSAYSSSWTLRVTGAFALLFLLLSPIGMDVNTLDHWPATPVLIASFFCLFTLAGLTKEQFTTPAARLVPGFARHHLVVAGALPAGLCMVVAGVLAATTAATLAGSAAILLTCFAFIAWGSCLQPAVLLIFAVLGLLPRMTGGYSELLAPILRGEHPVVSTCLLVASTVWFAVLGRRLARLTEDQPAYQRWFSHQGPIWGPQSALTDDQKRAISRSRTVHRRGLQLERFVALPTKGLYRESRRLRLAAGNPSPAFLVPAVMGAACIGYLGYDWFINGIHWPNEFPTRMGTFAGILVVAVWGGYRKNIAQEASRPVSRARLLRQLGLLMLLDLLAVWAVVAVMVMAVWLVMSPWRLADPHTYVGILSTFCWVPLLLAVMALIMLIRSDLVYFIVGMPLLAAGSVIVELKVHDPLLHWPVAIVVVAAVGASGCYAAYRTWMEADLA